MMNPKVSVCITAYNHEKYIAQALDSVLAQKIDHPFEIIIGEDGSTDRTREIVQSYAEQHPEIIRLFLNDRENVIYIDGKPTGRWNFYNNIKNARGEYIALLDGDDYWVDDEKLQIQVDFLDKNKSFSICFNKTEVMCDEDYMSKHDNYYSNENQKKHTTVKDLIEKWYMMTGSIVFRKESLTSFPEFLFKAKSGDYSLELVLASAGDIYYIDRLMSVYRKHNCGMHTTLIDREKFYKNIIYIMIKFNRFTNGKYIKEITSRLDDVYCSLSSEYLPTKHNSMRFIYSFCRFFVYWFIKLKYKLLDKYNMDIPAT